MNKQEALDLIQKEWDDFLNLLATLSEQQQIAPTLAGNWSVKDTLVHLSAWEAELTRWLSAANAGNNPGVPKFTDDYINQFNEKIYLDNRQRSYADVYANLRATHDAAVAQIKALPDDPNDPKWALWQRPDGPWSLIEGNTYGHFREHADTIRAWLANQSA